MISPEHSDESRIEKILSRINDILIGQPPVAYPGLLIGNSGIALYLAYYYIHFKCDDAQYEAIEQLLYRILEQLNEIPIPPHLATGKTGICRLLRSMIALNILDDSADELLSGLEQQVAAFAASAGNDIDPLYGSIGCLSYLAEHQGITPGIAAAARDGISSWAAAQSPGPEKEIGLGLAHGMAGVGTFILKHETLAKPGILSRINELFLSIDISYSMQEPGLCSVFPNSYRTDQVSGSRYAWCNGDLGILYFFNQLIRADHSEAAGELHGKLVGQCNSRTLEDAFVLRHEELDCYDIGFCHGLAGIFHVQQSINRQAGTELLTTNRYWLDALLDHLERYLDREDFSKEIDGEAQHYDPKSLLEGIAGAGLVLISLLTEDYSWDSCLL